MNSTLFFVLSLLLSLLSIFSLQGVTGEANVVTCEKCVYTWNEFREYVGCDGNSSICNYIPFVSHDKCQAMINATCAAGCENNSTECAYAACCLVDICSGSVCNITL